MGGDLPQNKKLEIDAAEFRLCAERRLGEMLVEQKRTVGLSSGGERGDESEKTVPDNERLSILILILDQDCAVLGTDGTGVLRRSGFGHENLAASG
jgi:hypothetical protein